MKNPMNLESLLQKYELTEFERPASGPLPYVNKWCQSGAQAGWSPDIDEVRVEERGMVVEIDNDIFSERVIKLAASLRKMGYTVTMKFEPVTDEAFHDLGTSRDVVEAIINEAQHEV